MPCCWIGLAVFWSEGSITPAGNSVVQAPVQLPAYAIAGAILLMAPLKNARHIQSVYEDFLKRGLDIVNGGNGKL